MLLGVRSSTNNKAQEIKNVYIVCGIAEIMTFTRLSDNGRQLKSSRIGMIAGTIQ